MLDRLRPGKKYASTDETKESGPRPSTPLDEKVKAKLEAFAAEGFQLAPHNKGLDLHTICLGRPVAASLLFLQSTHLANAPMHIRRIDVEDPVMRGRGIGQLLLIKAVQRNLQRVNPDVKTVTLDPGNLVAAGLMQKVFGADNVTWQVDQQEPIAESIKDVSDLAQHMVYGLTADLDRERIMSVSINTKLSELAIHGHVDVGF